MPYVERVTRAGKTIEVERYFTSRYKKPGIKRGDKVKPTKEEQKKVNTRAAERKLRLLLNANFGYGDYHLELDYISSCVILWKFIKYRLPYDEGSSPP